MSISGKIADDYKDALKKGDRTRVSILRMIRAAVKNREIDKGSPLSDEEMLAVLRSFVKRARESIEQFSKAGRTELAEKEANELVVVEGYLPRQMSEDDLRDLIREVLSESGATGPGDIGRVMKAVMAKAQGRVDGKLASSLVRELLEVR